MAAEDEQEQTSRKQDGKRPELEGGGHRANSHMGTKSTIEHDTRAHSEEAEHIAASGRINQQAAEGDEGRGRTTGRELYNEAAHTRS